MRFDTINIELTVAIKPSRVVKAADDGALACSHRPDRQRKRHHPSKTRMKGGSSKILLDLDNMILARLRCRWYDLVSGTR